MNTRFVTKSLRLLSYVTVFAGAFVACIDLSNGATPAYTIAATVAGAAVLQIASAILEGRRHG